MEIVLWILIAVIFQTGLNAISTKQGYGLSKNLQVVAVVSNVVLFAVFGLKFGHSMDMIIVSLGTSILISAFFVDYKHYIIPNGYNLTLFALAVCYVINNSHFLRDLTLGGLCFFGVFLLLMLISKGNLGGGDVKLAVSLGLFLGFHSFMTYMVVTFVASAFLSLCLLVMKVKKSDDKIPFGPFMILAFIYLMFPW